MSHRISRAARALPAFVSLAFVWLTSPASASLGGDADSVSADSVEFKGQRLLRTAMPQFDRHDITTGSGTVVHEYLSRAGKVFAVSWQGSVHPDLRQLLGTYFEQYTQAVQAERAHRRGHGPLRIEQPGLVIQLEGHMRSYRGRVYVPQMLPAGVHAEDIR